LSHHAEASIVELDHTKCIVEVDSLFLFDKFGGVGTSSEVHFMFNSAGVHFQAHVFNCVNILVASCVENCTVIIEISAHSEEMGIIFAWVNVEVNWVLLEISRIHDSESFGILHRNDISFSKMEMEIVGLRSKSQVLACFDYFTRLILDNNVAPSSIWEIKVSRIDSNLIGKNTEFKCTTNHDIVLMIPS
jgi:hypothetical protein